MKEFLKLLRHESKWNHVFGKDKESVIITGRIHHSTKEDSVVIPLLSYCSAVLHALVIHSVNFNFYSATADLSAWPYSLPRANSL